MDYTKIIVSFITLLAAIADAFIIPWIKTKIDSNRFEKLMQYVRIAVEAAEQIIGPSHGADKKQYVLNFLKESGINFDESVVDMAIEAIVLEMNNELLKDIKTDDYIAAKKASRTSIKSKQLLKQEKQDKTISE